MSKKQTRRSISVSGETYDRLREYVKTRGVSGSRVVEDMLRAFFEMPERDQKVAVEVIPRFERKAPTEAKVVLTSPVLGGKSAAWVDKTEAVTVDRAEQIKRVHQAAPVRPPPGAPPTHQLRGRFEPPKEEKKPDPVLGDMASKIFTF